MKNDARRAVYLRDRTELTPAQRQRIKKHDHDDLATVPRVQMRRAHRAVKAAARESAASVRLYFSLLRRAS